MSWVAVKQSSFLQPTAPYQTRRCVFVYENLQELLDRSRTVLPKNGPHPRAVERRVVGLIEAAARRSDKRNIRQRIEAETMRLAYNDLFNLHRGVVQFD